MITINDDNCVKYTYEFEFVGTTCPELSIPRYCRRFEVEAENADEAVKKASNDILWPRFIRNQDDYRVFWIPEDKEGEVMFTSALSDSGVAYHWKQTD